MNERDLLEKEKLESLLKHYGFTYDLVETVVKGGYMVSIQLWLNGVFKARYGSWSYKSLLSNVSNLVLHGVQSFKM